MLIKNLTSLNGKNVNIETIDYVRGESYSDKGVVTGVISGGYEGVFVELDSKTLINVKYARRIEILD